MCERDPIVPATITLNAPGIEPVQFSVEVPESVTLVGVRVQVRPVGETVEVSDTTPLKPFTAFMVTVEEAEPDCAMLMLVWLALMVKSCTVTVAVAVWVILLLVPITVIVYTPAAPEHESVED